MRRHGEILGAVGIRFHGREAKQSLCIPMVDLLEHVVRKTYAVDGPCTLDGRRMSEPAIGRLEEAPRRQKEEVHIALRVSSRRSSTQNEDSRSDLQIGPEKNAIGMLHDDPPRLHRSPANLGDSRGG